MAVLTSFRDPGGQVGDEYIDEQGRWFIQVVYRDTDYFWALVEPFPNPQPPTTISDLITEIQVDVDAVEAEVDVIQGQVATLEVDVDTLEVAQAQDEIDVDNLLSRVGILEIDLDAAEIDIINLQNEVDLPDLIVLFNNAVL